MAKLFNQGGVNKKKAKKINSYLTFTEGPNLFLPKNRIPPQMKKKPTNIIPWFYYLGWILFAVFLVQCQSRAGKTPSANLTLYDKQKGAHVFGRIDTINFQAMRAAHIDWITLVAWASQEDYDRPMMKHHYGDRLQTIRRDSMWLKRLQNAKEAGFKVFVKPHIWIDEPSAGKWRSDIYPNNEADWETWKKSYRSFILRYAKIAAQGQAEMFCIGTELTRLSVEKPNFWKGLIQEVRTIYPGKITYAANWYQEFDQITFWDQLDYIGIQAYFPLVDQHYPSTQAISDGWQQHIPAIVATHKQFNRKILFTEMGYKSTADSASKPWEWMEYSPQADSLFSLETQRNCYQAFFDTVWDQAWFAGVHLWQLRGDFVVDPKRRDLDFTPQGKPAMGVIGEGFR
ncbi:MAG: hypothetical protein AB8G15_16175 [Saprospiraceae bacterium]